VIGDKVSAEALVMEAIESLDPENVTGETLRADDAVRKWQTARNEKLIPST
jgi:hypothetical protein